MEAKEDGGWRSVTWCGASSIVNGARRAADKAVRDNVYEGMESREKWRRRTWDDGDDEEEDDGLAPHLPVRRCVDGCRRRS
jgi:hypothetical protein